MLDDGTRLKVLFENGQWFEGEVRGREVTQGQHLIYFDDGETHWLTLEDMTWKVLQGAPGAADDAGDDDEEQLQQQQQQEHGGEGVAPRSTADSRTNYPLGARIEVLFGDKLWHPGSVTAQRMNDEGGGGEGGGGGMSCHVAFDDGDTAWVDLTVAHHREGVQEKEARPGTGGEALEELMREVRRSSAWDVVFVAPVAPACWCLLGSCCSVGKREEEPTSVGCPAI